MRTSHWFMAILLAMAVGAALGACSSSSRDDGDGNGNGNGTPDAGNTAVPDAGTGGEPDAGTPPEGCGTLKWSQNADCNTCMSDTCCAELEACTDGTPCKAVLDCLAACAQGDQACQQQCVADHQDAMADARALVNCSSGCDSTCKTSTPICDSGLTASPPACGECLTTHCCDPVKACKDDPTCLACLTGQKTGPECDASAVVQAANSCVATSCATECQ